MRELDQSRRSCLKAVHSEKRYVKAIILLKTLGFRYIFNKKYDAAIRTFTHLKVFAPEDADLGTTWAWIEKSRALRALGKKEKAIEACEVAISIAPRDASIWDIMGDVLISLDQNKKAIEAYKKAIDFGPKDAASVWNSMGDALRKEKRYKEAIEAHEEALKIDRKNALAKSSIDLIKTETDSSSDT
jgi:tetratricopeptide (TPR) repeat protein